MQLTDGGNAGLALDARRDIIMMYVDMVESYGGFGHSIDTGTFQALEFIDVALVERPGFSVGVDIGLLHKGAAVALLCDLWDMWNDHDEWQVDLAPGWEDEEWTPNRVQGTSKAMKAGRLVHLPADIQRAFALAFEISEDAFWQQLKIVYQEHVLGFFKRLLKT